MHENLINIRQKFKLSVKEKETQNKNLKILCLKITKLIEEIKLKNKNNYYADTKDIINEESKENYIQTNIDSSENDIKSNNFEKCRNIIFNN